MGFVRLLLAISVVVFHTGQTFFGAQLNGGSLAVQLFFVISGFYMSLILNEKYKKGASTYYLFISNRLVRLYPLYFVIVLLSIAVYTVDCFYFNSYGNWLGNFTAHINELNRSSLLYIFFSNLLIVGQDLALFMGVDLQSGTLFFTKNFHATSPQANSFMILGQAWTISIEIGFYLIAPFVVRKGVKNVLLYIVAALLLRLFIYHVLHMKYDPWTYRFFPTEMIYFLLGYLCYKAYKYLQKQEVPRGYLYPIAVFLWSFIIFYGNIFSLLNGIHLYQTLLHIGYITAFVGSLPFVFLLTKNSKLDSQVGELSYPIYLCHTLFMYLDNRFAVNSVYFVVFASVFLSFLLNHLVAKRVELIRQRRVQLTQLKQEPVAAEFLLS
jgi:peptidoglycan/LPS O-acetylase OafA/YrhL